MKISIRNVLSEINRSGSVFSIRYRRVSDALGGQKSRCSLPVRNQNGQLNERKKWNRSGQIRLVDLDTGEKFQLYIDLLTHFNETEIDHRL